MALSKYLSQKRANLLSWWPQFRPRWAVEVPGKVRQVAQRDVDKTLPEAPFGSLG